LFFGVIESEVVSWVAFVGFNVQAALEVNVVVGSSLEDTTNGLGFIGTAEVVVGVEALVTTALDCSVVVLGEEVSTAADSVVGVEGLEVAALSVGWGSDLELNVGFDLVGGASFAAGVNSLEVADLLRAASLLGGIEALASTAGKGAIGILGDNVSVTADLSVSVKSSEGTVFATSEGGTAGDLTSVDGDGHFVSVLVSESGSVSDGAASLLGLIESRVTAAFENTVVAASNTWVVGVTTAKLGVGIISLVTTALLVVGLSVGDDVVVGGEAGSVALGGLD
jgi:hypothetical protein